MTRIMFMWLCISLVSVYPAQVTSIPSLKFCASHCPRDYCPLSGHSDSYPCSRPKDCPDSCGFNQRRTANGSCISITSCPPFPCLGVHEEYNLCPPYCPGEDCSSATADSACHVFGIIDIVVECQPACRCKKGFWRKNNTCASYNECHSN